MECIAQNQVSYRNVANPKKFFLDFIPPFLARGHAIHLQTLEILYYRYIYLWKRLK